MLSHRDIIRALRTALKALPEHPHACDVVAAPGSGTRTIVVRDSRGRPLLTVSALAAVYAPALPGREQRAAVREYFAAIDEERALDVAAVTMPARWPDAYARAVDQRDAAHARVQVTEATLRRIAEPISEDGR